MPSKDTSFVLLLSKAEQYFEHLYTFQEIMKEPIVLHIFIPGNFRMLCKY